MFQKAQKNAFSQIRTDDLLITSEVPYQLGHKGITEKVSADSIYQQSGTKIISTDTINGRISSSQDPYYL